MGRLTDFKTYLEGRRTFLEGVEKRLCGLQSKFENFFSEVSKTRENEFDQLREHIVSSRDKLPPDFIRELDAALAKASEDLQKEIKAIEAQRDGKLASAEKKRTDSIKREKFVRDKNTELDAQEEHLKIRSAALLKDIEEYNQRILEMSRGFGFFWSLFAMRTLKKEREALDVEQTDVSARIDALRLKWIDTDKEWADREAGLRRDWILARTEADAFATKIDYLNDAAPRITENV